jgi:hypothetical protein
VTVDQFEAVVRAVAKNGLTAFPVIRAEPSDPLVQLTQLTRRFATPLLPSDIGLV